MTSFITSGPGPYTVIEKDCMVNVLKFRTLFSFSSQIKCWLSELEFTNACQNNKQRLDPDQTGSSEAVLSGSALFV